MAIKDSLKLKLIVITVYDKMFILFIHKNGKKRTKTKHCYHILQQNSQDFFFFLIFAKN